MAGFKIVKKEGVQTRHRAIRELLVVAGFVFAMFASVFSILGVEKNLYQILCTVGITIPFSYLFVQKKERRVWRIGIIMLIILVFSAILWKTMLSGLAVYINRFIELRNKFNGTSQPILGLETSIFSQILVLIVLEVSVGIVLIWMIEARKGLIGAFILGLIPVLVGLNAGKFPSVVSSLGLIAAGCFYVMIYRNQNEMLGRRELLPMLSMLLIICMSATVLQPALETYKERHKETYAKIKDTLYTVGESSFWKIGDIIAELGKGNSNFAGGGIGKGNLNGLESFNPLGKKEMEIVVSKKPTETMYLKAYVGVTYTGTEWKRSGTLDLSKVVGTFNTEKKERSLMNEPFRRITEGANGLVAETMEISIINASTEFAYTPYYVKLTSKDEVYLDAYVKGEGKEKRKFQYYPAELVSELSASSLDASSKLWSKYQSFVKKEYVHEYKDLEQLNRFCDTIPKNSADSVSNAINGMFHQNLKYSRVPGKMPSDMDFVEGFLFQKQVGFCVHFATSATVIYQNCGIPARYVEGYAVSASAFEEQSDGTYKAIVTDADAHAWCETFDTELGWEIREHTTAYVQDSSSFYTDDPVGEDTIISSSMGTNEDSPQRGPEPDTALEEEEEKEESNESDSSEKQEKTSGIEKAFIRVLIAAGVVVVVYMFVVIQQKVRRRKRFLSFRRKGENQGITNMYNAIYDMCVFAGVLTGEESERERICKIEETFLELSPEEWQKIYLYAEYAAFSQKIFTKQEQKELYQLYCKLRRALLKTFTWHQRIWFLYGKAF